MNGAARPERPARLESFPYTPPTEPPPPCTNLDLPCVDSSGRLVIESAEFNSGSVAVEDMEQRLADEVRSSFEAGRAERD